MSNFCIAQTNGYKSLADVVAEIDSVKLLCLAKQPILLSKVDGRTEEWRQYSYGDDKELLIVTSGEPSADYSELFITVDEILVYAEESVITYSQRPDLRTPWTCQYLLSELEVVDYISLGHGETEDENWRPESIVDQWKARMTAYDRAKK